MSEQTDTRKPRVIQWIAAEINRRLRKNELGLMNETVNPLWNIDAKQAQLIYDCARSGNYAQIQYLYDEIESKDPTLGVCVTRRTSAVAELNWRVTPAGSSTDDPDLASLAEEQIAFLKSEMERVDNLPDALEHLALAPFRGFSIVAPVHDHAGSIRHFDLVDGWNICYDRLAGRWLFNPSASSFFMPTNYALAAQGASPSGLAARLEPIPPEQICVVTRKREIDWPAMQIHLRCTVAERDWGRFLETYGLPPVIITMPEFTSNEDQDEYLAAAQSVFEGRSGVVPHGSEVNYASESRGTDPFSAFIEHQQKLIVMMATGGTLATLSEATGIGSGASGVQQDEWQRIIRADKRIISNAINKQVCERLVRGCRDFRGRPVLAEFILDDTPKPTPKEMLDLAGSASGAGFDMDAEELSQAIGYKLERRREGGFAVGNASPRGGGLPAASEPPVAVVTNAAEGGVADDNDGGGDGDGADGREKAAVELAKSLKADFGAVAGRIEQILAMPEGERADAAARLCGELDALVPDDPAMAAVIADQMEEAFLRQLDGGGDAAP